MLTDPHAVHTILSPETEKETSLNIWMVALYKSTTALVNSEGIPGTYFKTNLSRFGLAGLPRATILDF